MPRIAFCCIMLLYFAAAPLSAQEATPEPTAEPMLAASTAEAAAEDSGEYTTYVIRPGDNLYRIALRFNTTVRRLAELNGIVNPSLILTGQQLRVPVSGSVTPTTTPAPTATAVATAAPTATTAATPAPTTGATTTYTVARGDTLYRIAVRFNTTVAQLVQLNNLDNPNFVYVGQQLRVPAAGSTAALATSEPTADVIVAATDAPEATPGTVQATATPLVDTFARDMPFGYGVIAYLNGSDDQSALTQIETLGMNWVKVDVYWRDIELVQGEINFTILDGIVENLNRAGLNILFTVSTAPDWSFEAACTGAFAVRPPDDLNDYGTFIGALAERYAGRVQAYEVWSEPNIRRQWSNADCSGMNPQSYMDLLSVAYAAVKAVDSTAIVISAGLSPTGWDDRVNAINDRVFLRGLYANGLAQVSDAVGVRPTGFANPPDAECCEAAEGVETHFEHPSFYFLNTINDYRQIMIQNGDTATPLWVTGFGWGSTDGINAPTPQYSPYLAYTDAAEQAAYLADALELGAGLDFVGAMFVDNLNACTTPQDNSELCFYSLITQDGASRPAFESVASVEK